MEVRFYPAPDGVRMISQDGRDVVAVHQVLSVPVFRSLDRVLAELGAGRIFVGQQGPAPNTYLRLADALDDDALFPYENTVPGTTDRVSLVIDRILPGASSFSPSRIGAPYFVGSGVIAEVRVQTHQPQYYERLMRVCSTEQRDAETNGL